MQIIILKMNEKRTGSAIKSEAGQKIDEINESITIFMQQQTCATVCCKDKDGTPYCFSCYYIFNPTKGLLYFKSSENAHHFDLLGNTSAIAGTVHPDKLMKLITRGVQWGGSILDEFHPLAGNASAIYHTSIPMALAMKGRVFTILLETIKMTDSKLGFGKKIIWQRDRINQ